MRPKPLISLNIVGVDFSRNLKLLVCTGTIMPQLNCRSKTRKIVLPSFSGTLCISDKGSSCTAN